VIAQAAHLVFGLGFDVELEVVGARLPVVAEHEVLPDHDAQFVADRVELVGLVVAAAPVANHVHVGVARRLENAAIVGRGDAIGKAVEGNHIRALGEDGNAVDHQLKERPHCPDCDEDDGTQAGLGLACFRGGLPPEATCAVNS
jgi:hypothetical protein